MFCWAKLWQWFCISTTFHPLQSMETLAYIVQVFFFYKWSICFSVFTTICHHKNINLCTSGWFSMLKEVFYVNLSIMPCLASTSYDNGFAFQLFFTPFSIHSVETLAYIRYMFFLPLCATWWSIFARVFTISLRKEVSQPEHFADFWLRQVVTTIFYFSHCRHLHILVYPFFCIRNHSCTFWWLKKHLKSTWAY